MSHEFKGAIMNNISYFRKCDSILSLNIYIQKIEFRSGMSTCELLFCVRTLTQK